MWVSCFQAHVKGIIMALRFVDGFDHYVTADITKKWNSNDGGTISASGGRRSSGAVTVAQGSTKKILKTLDPRQRGLLDLRLALLLFQLPVLTFCGLTTQVPGNAILDLIVTVLLALLEMEQRLQGGRPHSPLAAALFIS